MAILSITDYGKLRDIIYRPGDGKEELKSLPGLPSKSQLTACFQAVEDRAVTAMTLAKADIELVLGRAITAGAMRKFVRAWASWKFEQGG